MSDVENEAGGEATPGDAEAGLAAIANYERRIAFALERIGQGFGIALARAADAAAQASPALEAERAEDAAALRNEDEVAALRAELEAARAANAQLSERVRAIREKQETTLAALEKRLAAANQAVAARAEDLARLSEANQALVEANRVLLAAAGAPDAETVEAALLAELETLRAARAAETAELGAVLDGLEPLIAAHATKGGHSDA